MKIQGIIIQETTIVEIVDKVNAVGDAHAKIIVDPVRIGTKVKDVRIGTKNLQKKESPANPKIVKTINQEESKGLPEKTTIHLSKDLTTRGTPKINLANNENHPQNNRPKQPGLKDFLVKSLVLKQRAGTTAHYFS